MKYKIYIEDQLIDTQQAKFKINLSLTELQNFTKRKAFKTSTIKVPATPTNQQVFTYLEEVGVRFPSSQLTGYISFGALTFKGYVKLYDTTYKDGLAYYQFQIITADWLDTLKGVKLSDLDWTNENHTITAATINASEAGTLNYIYPLIDYGKFKEDADVKAVERFPVIAVDAIFTKIMDYCGYTQNSGSIFEQAANQKYFILDTDKIYLNDPDFEENRLFMATCDYEFEQEVPASTTDALNLTDVTIPFDDVTSVEDLFQDTDNYSIITYKYTVDVAGAYRFQTSLTWGWVATSMEADFTATFVIEKNGSTVLDTFTTAAQEGAAGGSDSTPTLLDSSYIHLSASDYITVNLTLTGDCVNDTASARSFFFSVTNVSRFYNDADPRRGLNYPLTFADIVPDVECIKFLQAVNGVFNLWFYQNVHERELLIEQAADFHATTVTDWSSKLDLSKPVKISKYEAPKTIEYSYAEDSKDFIVSGQSGYLKSDYDFTNNQKGVETVKNNYFARTWFNYCRRIGLDSINKIPVLWKEYDIEEEPIPGWSHDFKARLLYFDSNATISPDGWTFEGSPKTTVPYFTETNLLPSDIKDNYTWVHKNMELSKVVEAYFKLSANDVSDFLNLISGADFRTPIYIDTEVLRGNYYVMAISGFSTTGGSTKVKLLQVNDKTVQ